MHLLTLKRTSMLAMTFVISSALVGCEEKGTAGKAGQTIDNVVDPRGPLQKTGDKLDKAVEGK